METPVLPLSVLPLPVLPLPVLPLPVLPLPSKESFSFLNKFKENKSYLFIVIGIILLSAILYYLYIKNKDKKEKEKEKEKEKKEEFNNKMLDVIKPNENTNEKLLYNPIDKQYYKSNSSGETIKTSLENSKTPQQMAQQQMAQQQMAQQQMVQQQKVQQQKVQQQKVQTPKLKHQIESESDESTSENTEYNVNELDQDENISKYNLDTEDMQEINAKLSDNS